MLDNLLEGVRVVEFGQFMAAPHATLLMAQLGAEVIKIERFPGGDPGRGIGPFARNRESLWFTQQNRGKKSIALDVKAPEGRELALLLCDSANAVVENFRPGTLARLGFGYDALHRRNPKLVLCSISAFGQTGPYASRPGYGPLVEAAAGVTELTGEPSGPPMPTRYMIADALGASHAFGAVCAALLRAARTGEGRHVDISLFDCMLEGHDLPFVRYFGSRGADVITRRGLTDDLVVPLGVFPVGGRWIAIHLATEANWRHLATAIGRSDLATDPALASIEGRRLGRARVEAAIRAWLASRTDVTATAAELQNAGVPAEIVQSIDEVVRDPQARSRRMFLPQCLGGEDYEFVDIGIRTGQPPPATAGRAPCLGEDSQAVLEALGCATPEIRHLAACKVVRLHREVPSHVDA